MIKTFLKYILFILFLNNPIILFGQHFETIDISNGLSNNTVRCITQDENGFIWFGTYDGLCRYDGVNIAVFRNEKNNILSISQNNITSMLPVKGGLWVGTEFGLDFLSFKGYKFKKAIYLDKSGFQKNIVSFIRSIVKVGNSVFALSSDEGLLYLNKNNVFEPYLIDGISTIGAKILMIASYKQNKLIINSTEGLHIINTNKHKIECEVFYKTNSTTTQIYYSTNKNLIYVNSGIGFVSKIFRIKDNKIEIYPNEEIKNIQSTIDYNEDVVFGSDGEGLLFMDKKRRKKVNPDNSNISSDAIYSLFIDNENNLWVGTLRGGVNMINKRNDWFKNLSVKNKKLSHDFVTSIYKTSNNKLFVGTDGGGLNVYDQLSGKLRTYTTDNSKIAGNHVLSVIGDEEYLWFGLYENGFSRLDIKTGVFKKYKLPIQNESKVWVVRDDQKGNIWIGSDQGLFCFNKKKEKFIISQNLIPQVSEIAFSKNTIWVSSNGGGLYNIDFSGKILKHYSKDKNSGLISNDFVRYVFIDSNDFVWFGTEYTGLNKLNKKGEIIGVYGNEAGLDNLNVVGIVEAKNGDLWISSSDGLYRFNPKNEVFLHFGYEDNFLSTQFAYNACYYHDKNIYFGTSKGLIWFNPDEVRYDSHPTNVQFVGFELLNNKDSKLSKSQDLTSPIELTYNNNFFKISFTKPNFICQDKIKFSAYLENFEKGWQEIGKKRELSYTNVPPGEYIFHVKATDCNGVWSKTYSSLKIIILPPWWQTNWALFIFAILIIGILYIIFSIYMRGINIKHEYELSEIEKNITKNINEAKLRFFTNISHELRTPLFLLTAPLEELISFDEKSKFIQVPRKHLVSMYGNTMRLNKLIDRIIDFRKLEAGKLKLELQQSNIVSFCKELVNSFEVLCEQKNILFLFLPSKTEIQLCFDPNMMESIISNLVGNAFKYTNNEGKIILSIKEEANSVVFTVEDNGIGIQKEYHESIFERFMQISEAPGNIKGDGIGLSFVSELVELHGGVISVKSELGKGSIFTFKIPNNLFVKEDVKIVKDEVSTNTKDLLELNSKSVDNLPNPAALNSILIIDDEREVVEVIERILIKDFTIFKAYDGKEGLDIAQKIFPDIIICDVMMPFMNGIDFVSTIKKNKSLAHVPIIMLTAKTAEKDMLLAFDCGADVYLTKPISVDYLKKRVEQLINKNDEREVSQFFTAEKTKYSKEEKKFLAKCKGIIDENIHDSDFNISVILNEMGMSHSTFYKKLKQLTGQSIKGFIDAYRLHKAIQMFLEGETNITTVRSKCGFNNAKNFRDSFKKKMGVSPKEFIKNL